MLDWILSIVLIGCVVVLSFMWVDMLVSWARQRFGRQDYRGSDREQA